MLKTMVDYDVMFYVMGVVALIGVFSKMVSQFALRRLLRAAGNMNKSTHKLMKLMRAKFEHACMVSDRVQNVNAFVEKYVFEYRAAGLRLHTWQQLQRQAMWACAILGGIGAGMYYATYGMGETVYQYGGIGGALMVLLFLLQVTTDEKYLLKSSQVYMVDYLENVCAHRYEKMAQRENAARMSGGNGQAVFAGAGAADVQQSTAAQRSASGQQNMAAQQNKGGQQREPGTKSGAGNPASGGYQPLGGQKNASRQNEKVISMEKSVEAGSKEDSRESFKDRKRRKEMRREAQETQKKHRLGKRSQDRASEHALEQEAEPEEEYLYSQVQSMPEPEVSQMKETAPAQREEEESLEEAFRQSGYIHQATGTEGPGPLNENEDSAPKEALIREILEEFLAQRT